MHSPSESPVARSAEARPRVIWLNRFFYPDESATSMMLTDLVRALVDVGDWQNRVITSSASYAGPDSARAAPLPGVSVRQVPAIGASNRGLVLRLFNFVLFYVGALFWLLRDVRRGDVIVSLTDPPLIDVISGFVARLKGASTVNWVQDIYPETAVRLGYAREGGLLPRLLCALRSEAWQRETAIVAIGDRMRDFIASNDVDAEGITVIPNWTDDHDLLPLPAAENALRTGWDYAPGQCVIGYSGNLGRAHEIDTMIGAMEDLFAGGDLPTTFLFIGGGARQDDLREAAARLPAGAVSFQNYQPRTQLRESLSVPDIHWISLQPQLEGLIVPSKLFGAMAVGRPIVFVGEADGEIPRILRAADCGRGFEPGQTAELAQWLREMAADPVRRAEMGRNARSYLDMHFRREARVQDWASLLQSLLHGRNDKGYVAA